MKYYLYPSLPSQSKSLLNPYIIDFNKALDENAQLINSGIYTNAATIDLLKKVFAADVYIFNWIENTPYKNHGLIQSLVFLFLIFPILKIRGVKIVWVFHNFNSHQGTSKLSNYIKSLMLNNSDIIITHSGEAAEYLETVTNKKTEICFFNHPIKNRNISIAESEKIYDFLIWGSIEPYKGVVDYLKYLNEAKDQALKIKIVGKCKDEKYAKQIESLLTPNISFENRIVSFEELEALIKKSRFVLFPYLTESVSSSGALIDTISYGGIPIGPHRGAFADLENEGICHTYNKYEDIKAILNGKGFVVDSSVIKKFIKNNTWEIFAKNIISICEKI